MEGIAKIDVWRVRNAYKISLEGKLGAILTLSWHVKLNFGVKMAKLMALRGLRGTKLALKGHLGAPKEAPRRVTVANAGLGRAG